MTEDEARDVTRQIVGSAALATLDRLASLIVAENERQNLIARSTVSAIWSRHLLDSVQLLRWNNGATGPWLDIGTGGGFPGLAIATAVDRPVLLVEPRRRRAAFLADAAGELRLANVTVAATKVEQVDAGAATISARAVAPIGNLLRAAGPCATPATTWLLLRGVMDGQEIASLRRQHPEQVFHVEQSITDTASSIVRINGKLAS